MKLISTFLGMCLIAGLNAQQLDKSVFPIAGIAPGQNVITASAGELVGGSFESSTFYIGHGFQNSTERNTTSVTLPDLEANIKIYPNPTKDYFLVTISRPQDFQNFYYQILNQWGQRIQEGQIFDGAEHKIQTNALAPGSYYFRLFKEGKAKVLPFMITK